MRLRAQRNHERVLRQHSLSPATCVYYSVAGIAGHVRAGQGGVWMLVLVFTKDPRKGPQTALP